MKYKPVLKRFIRFDIFTKTGTLKSLHIYTVGKKVKIAIRFNTDYPTAGQAIYSVKLGNEMKKVNYRLIPLPLSLAKEYRRLIKQVFV